MIMPIPAGSPQQPGLAGELGFRWAVLQVHNILFLPGNNKKKRNKQKKHLQIYSLDTELDWYFKSPKVGV